MFYIPDLLQKKGPWAIVWLAGTYPKKAPSQFQHVNIHRICKEIQQCEVPLSLRLSSHLVQGLAHIYHHQSDKLYNDASLKLREISINFLPKRNKKRNKTKARLEDISLVPGEMGIAVSLWENYSELPSSDLLPLLPANPMLTSLSYAPHSQAPIEEITLPEFQQMDLQFEMPDDYFPPVEFQEGEGEGLFEEEFMFPVPQHIEEVLPSDDLFTPIPEPMDVKEPPIRNNRLQIEEGAPLPQAERRDPEIGAEDDEYMREEEIQKMKRIHYISLPFDNRTSLHAREIRQWIETDEELVIQRPLMDRFPYTKIKTDTFFASSHNTPALHECLQDVWDFLVTDIPEDHNYIQESPVGRIEIEEMEPEGPGSDFLPQFVAEPLRGGLDEQGERSVEILRKASISVRSTPMNFPMEYSNDSIDLFHHGGTSPTMESSVLFESPLPQRRASSVHFSGPSSPMYMEPQHYDGVGSIRDNIALYTAMDNDRQQMLAKAITEDSVKMLQYSRSKLQQLNSNSISFGCLMEDMNKRQVAKSFFHLLVLASTQHLEVLQFLPYGEITVRLGDSSFVS